MGKIKPDMVYLDTPPMRIVFTHSLKRVRKLYKQLGIEFDVSQHAPGKHGATTTVFANDKKPTIYLVWMPPDLEQSAANDAAILAHEATHVAISYLQDIGAENPDEELRAYTVQSVTRFLVARHFKWKQKQFDKQNGV